MKNDSLTSEFGQLFMAGLPGPDLDESTVELIRQYHVNNFILFTRNTLSPDQVHSLTRDLTAACSRIGVPPPLISIDQEGGTVARLPDPFSQFGDARMYAESAEPETSLENFALTCGHELHDVGINMNLAPVLDICPAGQDFFMEKRSLGNDPERVAALACLVIAKMQECGVAACAKHFPGLGAAKIDPHLHLPVVHRLREQLQADLIPFEKAISSGVAAVMTSHTVYTDLDPGVPATLSKKVLSGILRRQMGYEGVVITDDLEMGAIENDKLCEQAALESFLAGCDLLLICQDQNKVRKSCEQLVQAFDQGRFSADRVHQSLGRLARLRERFGIG
ncbi:MAG: beta-N-acetylhexosaminidase [Desulfobulbaceae bacterium]|nr:beta-N-acetylhexosaminidase [Desulfobulbaceae bacterium]